MISSASGNILPPFKVEPIMMAVLLQSVLLPLILFVATAHLISAQALINTAWTEPNSSLGDFGETFSANTTVNISWQPLNSSISDLWISAWNLGNDNYAERMEQSINISLAGNIQYGFTIPDAQLATTAQFVFHFVPIGATIGPLYFGPALSSPGFLVLAPSNVTLASSTSSSASITTSTRASSTSASFITSIIIAATNVPSAAATVLPASSSSSGMSPVTKICISIGVTVGVVLVATGAFLVARRHKKKLNAAQHRAVYKNNDEIYRKKGQGSMKDSSVRSELPGQAKATELDASRPRVEAPNGLEKEKVRQYIYELGS